MLNFVKAVDHKEEFMINLDLVIKITKNGIGNAVLWFVDGSYEITKIPYWQFVKEKL